MNSAERRIEILKAIKNSTEPVSGSRLSSLFGVSRQVIVQDIAILKTAGNNIISTSRGYAMEKPSYATRIVQTKHNDEEMEDELNTIVDLGGAVINVFVYHKIYGKIQAELNISDKKNISDFMESIRSGISKPLKNITSDYHYHLIRAVDEGTLNRIEEKLAQKGYLIK